MFIDYLLSDRHCARHGDCNHEQDNKTAYHRPSWDLRFRGYNQYARKCIMTFLFLLLIFVSSVSSNFKFISEAAS